MRNKLLNQYKKVSFKIFMANMTEQPNNKKLNNYNFKLQQLEKQLNEQGIYIH